MKIKKKTTPKTVTKTKLKAKGLGERYYPKSEAKSMNVEVPDSMFVETDVALTQLTNFLRKKYNVSIDEFVANRCGYKKVEDLTRFAYAEQIDSVALAIYQIEENGSSVIIADQTGIGKGVQAALVIKYAKKVRKTPIFFTEKENLFSDIYRDLIRVGAEDGLMCLENVVEGDKGRTVPIVYRSWNELPDIEKEEFSNSPDEYEVHKLENPTEVVFDRVKNENYDLSKGQHIVPFIVNTDDARNNIMHENGSLIYKAPPAKLQKTVISDCVLPKGYDLILCTYSQVARGYKVNQEKHKDGTVEYIPVLEGKAKFIEEMSKGNILILDESHNASGETSSTGLVMQECVKAAAGCLFLSATFAKKPSNMVIYSMKNILKEANLTSDEMKASVEKGGLALQELISASLVEAGQLIRRERGYAKSGAVVNWMMMNENISREMNDPAYQIFDLSKQHREVSDVFTDIMRSIIGYQKNYVVPYVDELKKEKAKAQENISINRQSKDLGASNPMFFSKVFQIISQMLLSIKVKAAAELAIMELRAGRKPVIALGNTMESFILEMVKKTGENIIPADFSYVLLKGLHGSLKVQTRSALGELAAEIVDEKSLGAAAQVEFSEIENKIISATTGIYISPIDYLKFLIRQAGFSVEEVTGRQSEIEYFNLPEQAKGLGKMRGEESVDTGVYCRVKPRVVPTPTSVFSGFNSNKIDCLIINQAGATGASAHAIPIPNVVAPSEVKQRSLIICQPELDINKETQKRGRVHRTGQMYPPIYYYLSSDIPAEKRLMMMLKSKLKSLDANTTSSAKQSGDIIKSEDFLNKYGDIVVYQEIWYDNEARKDESWYNSLNLSAYIKPRDADDNWSFDLKGSDGQEISVKDLATKVTGRIALLPVIEQERFYNIIVEKYQAYVADKVATGDYDLEMEIEDLQAELIGEVKPFVIGTGEGQSSFSSNTVIGKYSVNNNQKPYSVDELRYLLEKNQGQNQDLMGIKQICIDLENSSHKRYMSNLESFRSNKLGANEAWFQDLKKKTPEKMEELRVKNLEAEDNYEESKASEIADTKKTLNNLEKLFSILKVGSVLSLPPEYSNNNRLVRAVFLGFDIPNFVDSVKKLDKGDIKAIFALNHSSKKMTVRIFQESNSSLTMKAIYDAITNATQYESIDKIVEMWSAVTRDSMKGRKNASIITGNLLQAFGNANVNGRLVQFTMKDGRTLKGIYLKEASIDKLTKSDLVKIRIDGCLNIIRGRTSGNALNTNIKMSLFNQMNGSFRAILPMPKKIGGAYYTDPALLKYVEKRNFESLSGKMQAVILSENMEKFCQVLAQNHGVSAMLTRQELSFLPSNLLSQNREEEDFTKKELDKFEKISNILYKKFQKNANFALQSAS